VHSATALLATGQTGTPLRALIWLAAIQRSDGSFPQNSWIDGRAYWSGLQLDQVALPMLLARRLHEHNALGLFDPRPMIVRAAAFLILRGPVTSQDRWEENAGYSPSTLAVVIASLASTAQWAKEFGLTSAADFIFAYAVITSASIPATRMRPIRTPIQTQRRFNSRTAAVCIRRGMSSAATSFILCVSAFGMQMIQSSAILLK
jgi:glucoamylase